MLNKKKSKTKEKVIIKKEEKKSLLKKYLKIALFLLIVIVVVVIFFIWRHFQHPTSGQIKTVSETAVEKTLVSKERFEGQYFSFAHDSTYALKRHEKDFEKKNIILENAFFAEGEINSKKIAITVENLEGRTMADTGNFILRRRTPKIYIEDEFKVAEDISGVTFTKIEDGFLEKTFFISKRNYLAEIAFTGPITDDVQYDNEMNQLLKSIQWKK